MVDKRSCFASTALPFAWGAVGASDAVAPAADPPAVPPDPPDPPTALPGLLLQARQRGVVAPEAVQLHLVKEARHKSIGAAVCRKAEELRAEPLVVAAHDKGAIEVRGGALRLFLNGNGLAMCCGRYC